MLDHAAIKEAAANDLFALVTELVDDIRHGRVDSESLDAVQFIATQCMEDASAAPVGVAD